MIWQNPWAWLGLATLAAPIVIHMLGPRRARVQRFPSLRFLEASQRFTTRRARPSDLLLLAVRLAVLFAAVAALAQPLFLTAGRAQALGGRVTRAIIVDTSASMARALLSGPAGDRGVDAARREATRLARESEVSAVLSSAAPRRTLTGAAAWLGTQRGRREIIVLSDFQVGTLDAADLAGVPMDVGLRFIRIDVRADSAPLLRVVRHEGGETVARIALAPDRTSVEWTERPSPATGHGGVLILAGADERVRADAALAAAATVAPLPDSSSGRSVAIVYPGYQGRADLVRDAHPMREAWMAEVAAQLGRDAARPAAGFVNGRERMLLFSNVDAGSVESARLIAGVWRAMTVLPPASELEPATLSNETLRGWERAAAAGSPAQSGAGMSDGRWFWLLALALMGLEVWARRSSSESAARRAAARPPAEPEVHDRVA